jgi:hypothetical protein
MKKNKAIGYGGRAVNLPEGINTIPTLDSVDFDRDYLFTNLDMFKVSETNRPSEETDATVKKYYKMMADGEWFYELSPIWVGITSLKIENGENRRKAINLLREKKGIEPIIHIRFFDDTIDLKPKREALNGGRHWNSDDYVEALIQAGNKSFTYLKQFCIDEDHPQLHSVKGKPYYNKGAIVLGLKYQEFKKAYQTGEWDIPYNVSATAEKRYSELVRIKKAFRMDEASQDCWIPIGESWFKISNNPSFMNRIKSLNDGIEDFYKELTIIDNTNTSKASEWEKRMIMAIENAERKQ